MTDYDGRQVMPKAQYSYHLRRKKITLSGSVVFVSIYFYVSYLPERFSTIDGVIVKTRQHEENLVSSV